MRNTNRDQPKRFDEDRDDVKSSSSTAATTKSAMTGKPNHVRKDKTESNLKVPSADDKKGKHENVASTAETAKAAAKAMTEKLKSTDGEGGDSKERPRSKRFDKHHQKDRALRKFAATGGY